MVSINLLPDDLRRRSIRTRVIRNWVPVLAGLSIAIAVLSHFRWAQCRELAIHCEKTRPAAELGLQRLDDINSAEQRIRALRLELALHETLPTAQNPLNFLRIVTQATAESGDQLFISGIDILNTAGTANEQNLTVPGSETPTEETVEIRAQKTSLQLRGFAASEYSVTRLMNRLRQSKGFLSVQLKSSQPSRDSLEMQREFIVECTREELLQ